MTINIVEAHGIVREVIVALSASLEPEHPNLVFARDMLREIETLGGLTPDGASESRSESSSESKSEPKSESRSKDATTPPRP